MEAPPVATASGSTVLRLEGADALPLLDRISTRDLAALGPGEARWTLFCDYRGRLLHRALVAVTSDRAVWLLRDDAPGLALAAAVNAHVFREDVRIGVGDGRWSARLVPHAAADGEPAVAERDGAPLFVRAGAGLAMALVAPDAPPPGPASERARVLAGRPRHGHEIAQEFNPFEVNLAHEVHLAKGCYTGQEALQRLVTYDSVRRRLARVSGSGPAPAVPAVLLAGDATAGILTSTVAAEQGEAWLGLAVVRNEASGSGEALRVDSGATIGRVELFERTRPQGL